MEWRLSYLTFDLSQDTYMKHIYGFRQIDTKYGDTCFTFLPRFGSRFVF